MKVIDKDTFSSKKEAADALLRQISKESLKNENYFNPKQIAIKISSIYLILGSLWVLLSDNIAHELVQDKGALSRVSMIKGWVYVFATSTIIFSLIYSALIRVKMTRLELLESYKNLSATYEELESAYEEIAASEEELRRQLIQLFENQKKLMDNEERYRLISESTNDGIWEEVDNNRFFSDRWFEKTGYTREDIQNIGDWKSLIHTEDIGDVLRIVEDHKQLRTPFYACEYRFKLKNGSYIWLLARGKAQFNDEGKVTRMAGSHTDITDIKLYQERLQYLAYNDVLTNLPNRLSLYENATNQFFQNANSKLALLFIDADNFKLYNDTLGHAFGDQLIKQVGERLTSLLKENCFIYRLGGDEFLIILQNLKRKSDAEKFSSDILEGFNKALKIENSILHISISVGISIYPEHGKNIEELMKCADIAMYKAKEEGRNKYVLYDKSMNDDIVDRVNIEKCLRTSLKKNEFELYYQPQLDVENYKITGFEALLRWNSPELGFVSPSRFIKIAEDTHFIIQLGTWILRNACAFLKRLHEQGYNELTISVNISIIQLLQKDFVNIVMDALNINLLDTKYLELEITETVLIESYESIKEKLKDLREKGVLVALDDFGIGYSSLSYLKQLPISTLKIDKSFVDHISSEEKNKGLTGQIISIGKTMGLCVVAEGVETKEQLECLIKYRCTKFQGYYFSKALPEEEVFNLLDKAQN